MNGIQDYVDLITSEYATKEKFNSYVAAFLEMIEPAYQCLDNFNMLFELDTAVGDQLDKCGQLVALSRELPLSDPDIPSILPDSLFRIVIKARILSNFWDGTMQGWNNIIKAIFPNAAYAIIDNQDMSINVVMIDPSASTALVALLFNGYIIPKPAGVKVNWTVQDNALFGYDSDTSFIKGWDLGIWQDN